MQNVSKPDSATLHSDSAKSPQQTSKNNLLGRFTVTSNQKIALASAVQAVAIGIIAASAAATLIGVTAITWPVSMPVLILGAFALGVFGGALTATIINVAAIKIVNSMIRKDGLVQTPSREEKQVSHEHSSGILNHLEANFKQSVNFHCKGKTEDQLLHSIESDQERFHGIDINQIKKEIENETLEAKNSILFSNNQKFGNELVDFLNSNYAKNNQTFKDGLGENEKSEFSCNQRTTTLKTKLFLTEKFTPIERFEVIAVLEWDTAKVTITMNPIPQEDKEQQPEKLSQAITLLKKASQEKQALENDEINRIKELRCEFTHSNELTEAIFDYNLAMNRQKLRGKKIPTS